VKIGFYSPSLAIAGGGEKYFLTIMEEAVKCFPGDIILMSPSCPRPTDWERLGIAVEQESFTWRRTADRTLITGTRDLDLFVCMRLVPPLSHADRAVAIVQFPPRDLFTKRRARDPRGSARILRDSFERRIVSAYDLIVCYSDFARRYAAAYLGRSDAVVISPPVDRAVATWPKEPLILGVGRFIEMKRQDGLINAFRQLRASLPADSPWELHLAGGLNTAAEPQNYFAHLRHLADGLPVVFHPNASLATLSSLYERASIFWHAAGLGSDDVPIKQEHFGITTVEAMNHGCVPVVIALGGQPEIVTDGINGRLWRSLDELVAQTLALIASPDRRTSLGRIAANSGERFAIERFRQRAREVILPSAVSQSHNLRP
jgi:glycosyltransferase involved in cell wall biosynthesis